MAEFFFFSSRRRHTRWPRDWSSDVALPILLRLLRADPGGTRVVALTDDEEHLQFLCAAWPLRRLRSEERPCRERVKIAGDGGTLCIKRKIRAVRRWR